MCVCVSSPSMFPAVIMAISYKINNSRYHTALSTPLSLYSCTLLGFSKMAQLGMMW